MIQSCLTIVLQVLRYLSARLKFKIFIPLGFSLKEFLITLKAAFRTQCHPFKMFNNVFLAVLSAL